MTVINYNEFDCKKFLVRYFLHFSVLFDFIKVISWNISPCLADIREHVSYSYEFPEVQSHLWPMASQDS